MSYVKRPRTAESWRLLPRIPSFLPPFPVKQLSLEPSPLSPSLQLGTSLHSDSGTRRRETEPPGRRAYLSSRRVLTSPLFLAPIFLHLDSPPARPSRYTTPRDPLSFTFAFPFPCAEPPEARKPLIGRRLLFSRVMSKSVRSRPPFHFTTHLLLLHIPSIMRCCRDFLDSTAIHLPSSHRRCEIPVQTYLPQQNSCPKPCPSLSPLSTSSESSMSLSHWDFWSSATQLK